MNNQKSITVMEIFSMWLKPKLQALAHWWFKRVESHYLMSADVSAEQERHAQLSVAHFQKKAALARSNARKYE